MQVCSFQSFHCSNEKHFYKNNFLIFSLHNLIKNFLNAEKKMESDKLSQFVILNFFVNLKNFIFAFLLFKLCFVNFSIDFAVSTDNFGGRRSRNGSWNGILALFEEKVKYKMYTHIIQICTCI